MKIDCTKYQKALEGIRPYLISRNQDPIKTIGEMSIGSFIPLIAVVLYSMGDSIYGKRPELEQMRLNLMKFYRYTEIIPPETF